MKYCILLLAALASSALAATRAEAAGVYVTDRGVRPLGRGGAFVAGADDASSIWYNPAGLADAGTSVLADGAWLDYKTEFTRRTLVREASTGDSAVVTSPAVKGTTPFLPIPTIAATYAFGARREWTAALGVFAPMTALTRYPLDVDGAPSPARYSLVSLRGTALAIAGAWLAFKPIEQIRLGVGAGALTGVFKSTVALSAAPEDRLLSAPEDPRYDALTRIESGPIVAPTANAGITFVPHDMLRFGASFQLPIAIDAPADIDVRLPSAALFNGAHVEGTAARLAMSLPAVLRFGAELRPASALRLEAAFVRELWSIHRSIDVTPEGIGVCGVPGLPSPAKVAPISIPRNFRDTSSIRAGAEVAAGVGGNRLLARAGFAYEEGAIPAAFLTPLTVDLDKYTLSLGAGAELRSRLRIDAVYARSVMQRASVDPARAAVYRSAPLRGNRAASEAINGGDYAARASVVGLGINYRFQ